jgi:hypothetical protein
LVLMPLSEFRQWLFALYALTVTFGRVVANVEPIWTSLPTQFLVGSWQDDARASLGRV